MCFVCQVCVRVASAPCLIGSGRSRRRMARWWCVLTPTSCVTAGTGSMRTVITGRGTGIRWRYRWAGTGCPPAAWTLTSMCGTAELTRSTSLKVLLRVCSHAFEYKNWILAGKLKERCNAQVNFTFAVHLCYMYFALFCIIHLYFAVLIYFAFVKCIILHCTFVFCIICVLQGFFIFTNFPFFYAGYFA